MGLKTTLRLKRLLCLFFILSFYLNFNVVNAQTRVYATSISSQSQVDNATLSTDGNLTSRARVRASSGVAAGIGAYSGHLELQFGQLLPANTTSYIKIQTDDNLLPSLLGGNLGGLLADVAGVLLIGNQEFTVQARNGSTPVLTGNSETSSAFAGDRLRIVTNAAGEFFIMITPDAPYNRIRLTNRVGSLIGLGNIKRLDVFGAFYVSNPANCGNATYTSFSGSGISLDLLQLGQAGVQNPQNAIDSDLNNHSVLSLGLLGVGASIQQTVYFEGSSNANDQFGIRLRLSGTLLDLNVANNIRIIASNGGTVVQDQSLSTLLTLNLLSLQGGQIATIPITPGAPVDRITVRFSSLVGASVSQNLDFFGAVRTPGAPTITDPDTSDAQVCDGQSASLIAETSAGNELRWYDAQTGGTLLATVASGSAFTTPQLSQTTTYYVASARIGCTEESARVAVTVTVNIIPTPTTGNTTQEFCEYESPTLGDIQVNEAGVVFYDAETGGNQLPLTTALENNTIYYASLLDDGTGCESSERLAITVVLENMCAATLNVKVLLQGALFGSSGGLMRDNLRQLGLIPLSQPYSSSLNARFTHVNGGGTETTTQQILDAGAGTADAIVDWVFIEIRDVANSSNIIKTLSALLQRDGDVVAADGNPIVLDLPAEFFVAVKHRNHFGALSLQSATVTGAEATVDFTILEDDDLFVLSNTPGALAMTTVNGSRALYSGNANYDIRIKYDGAANDRQVVASQVLSDSGNTSQILNYANTTGYFSGDVNMDGRVLYDGANNDRQLILNIVITYPLNNNTLSNFNGMLEQIPN